MRKVQVKVTSVEADGKQEINEKYLNDGSGTLSPPEDPDQVGRIERMRTRRSSSSFALGFTMEQIEQMKQWNVDQLNPTSSFNN